MDFRGPFNNRLVEIETFTPHDILPVGQLVVLNGSGEVIPCSEADSKAIGVVHGTTFNGKTTIAKVQMF